MLNITNAERNANPVTVRYHFTSIKIVIIETKTKTSAGENVEKLEPLCTVGKMVQLLWKTVWQFLKTLNKTTI